MTTGPADTPGTTSHVLLYGAAYYPEQRDPSDWTADLDSMAQAGINALRVGEFAWGRLEPRCGAYDLDWLIRFRDAAWSRNIGLLLCPPLRTPPAWLVHAEPELRLVRSDGVTLEYGSRYSFCINHPLLRERGADLAAALGRQFGKDDAVLGWHLDNEHGDEPDCHCTLCKMLFQIWCEQRYRTIAALNRAWGMVFWSLEFAAFDQIPTPRVTKTYHNPGHLLDWRRFRSDCTIDAARIQADELRPRSRPEQFITTNHQVWNGRTDYYRMRSFLDRAGTNYYPPYGPAGALGGGDGFDLALCRSYQAGRPFQIHELRCGAHLVPGRAKNTPAPGEVARLAMHSLAHGAEGLFFFRWNACPFGAEQSHGSIVDFEGIPTRVYAEVARVGAWLARHGDRLAETRVASPLAVLVDFETRWTLDSGGAEWSAPAGLYMEQTTRLFRAFRHAGFSVDIVSREADWSSYRLVAIPALAACDAAMAEKVLSYAREGGLVIFQPLCGMKDEQGQIHGGRMHPAFRRAMGLALPDFVTLGVGETTRFEWQGRQYNGTLWADLAAPQNPDSVEGRYTEDWYADRPALTRHPLGAGSLWQVGTYAEPGFFTDLCRHLCSGMGIRTLLPGGLPEGMDVMERRAENGQSLLFVLNGTAQPRRVGLPGPMRSLDGPIPAPVVTQVDLAPYGTVVLEPASSTSAAN